MEENMERWFENLIGKTGSEIKSKMDDKTNELKANESRQRRKGRPGPTDTIHDYRGSINSIDRLELYLFTPHLSPTLKEGEEEIFKRIFDNMKD